MQHVLSSPAPQPRLLTIPEFARATALWQAGRDTLEIAELLRQPEAAVANSLAAHHDARFVA